MDREKVVKGLECLTHVNMAIYKSDCEKRQCPYRGMDCEIAVMNDALDLLKAQELCYGDAISRSALLAVYDTAHKGPPGGARKLIEEAPAVVLQAQEPRVMTLEEIPDAVFGWMEMFGQLIPCVLEDVYADDTVGFANIEDGHDYICASDYNKTWRCWTQKPSDAQREAVKWE